MNRVKSPIEVVTYADEYRLDFERLNLEWIEQFFTLEEADKNILADPVRKIIALGGQIFFVLDDNQIKGTCAVLKNSNTTYELAKMAVTASAQGKGFGDLLVKAAIAFAKERGAKKLILSTNTSYALRLNYMRNTDFKYYP